MSKTRKDQNFDGCALHLRGTRPRSDAQLTTVVPWRPPRDNMPQKIINAYHIMDARSISSKLGSKKCVDTTITSPPYWNLKDYGSRIQVGFGQKYEDYLDDLERIFSGVYRNTKSTGSLWVVADTIKHNGELKLFPFDLAARLKHVGWILHDIIVWHKDKTLPWSHRGKLRNIFEYILFFSKGSHFKYRLSQVRGTDDLKEWWVRYPERYSPLGKAPTRTWSIPIPRQGSWGENWVRHFCPLPPELVRRIVLLTTTRGNVVLDPFAGSGVVLAQAKALKRRFIGFDLRKSYRKMFERKVMPSIAVLEEHRKKDQHNGQRNRHKFSSLIWRLRKTKYPRELLRLYERQYGRTAVVGTVVMSQRKRALNISFIFAEGTKAPRGFISHIEKIMSGPPLSKYGLRAKVTAVTLRLGSGKSARNGLQVGQSLNLYLDGKTHLASGQMSVGEFFASIRNGLGRKGNSPLPIISNVRVRAFQNMIPND